MSRPIHVVVSLGTGRLPVKAVDVYDVYRPEGVVDIAKVVFGAKNLAELFVDQVRYGQQNIKQHYVMFMISFITVSYILIVYLPFAYLFTVLFFKIRFLFLFEFVHLN